MNAKTFAFAACCMAALCGWAQEDAPAADTATGPWETSGVLGLNFSQTYLENWQGGGQTSISGTVIASYTANYRKKKWAWETSFDAAYGLTRIGQGGDLQKTDDRVEIASKLSREMPVKNFAYSSQFTFRTQWDAGYNYEAEGVKLISDPFSPAYILLGIGANYQPSKAFSAYLSPVTGKVTIVDNQRLADQGAFGVEGAEYDTAGNKISDGENIRYEIGGFLKLQYQKEVLKNVKLNSRIDLFSNYLNNPLNIDINWETLIAMKINEYLSTSISVHLIYDDDINFAVDRNGDGIDDGTGPRTQLKEIFALGIQYQF